MIASVNSLKTSYANLLTFSTMIAGSSGSPSKLVMYLALVPSSSPLLTRFLTLIWVLVNSFAVQYTILWGQSPGGPSNRSLAGWSQTKGRDVGGTIPSWGTTPGGRDGAGRGRPQGWGVELELGVTLVCCCKFWNSAMTSALRSQIS